MIWERGSWGYNCRKVYGREIQLGGRGSSRWSDTKVHKGGAASPAPRSLSWARHGVCQTGLSQLPLPSGSSRFPLETQLKERARALFFLPRKTAVLTRCYHFTEIPHFQGQGCKKGFWRLGRDWLRKEAQPTARFGQQNIPVYNWKKASFQSGSDAPASRADTPPASPTGICQSIAEELRNPSLARYDKTVGKTPILPYFSFTVEVTSGKTWHSSTGLRGNASL